MRERERQREREREREMSVSSTLTSSMLRDSDVALNVPVMSNTLRQRNSLRTGFSCEGKGEGEGQEGLRGWDRGGGRYEGT